MFRIILTIIFTVLALSYSSVTQAIVDPREAPNNKFGIHISDISDVGPASLLVNSNGGEWGYVTIVIREDDRDLNKWQDVFDALRREKLIPIVRLATRFQDGNWIKPREEDFSSWVSFLNELNWVTKNRYLILFNEPNHSKEWGGTIDPEEYAHIYSGLQAKLKESNQDFFIMGAGLDTAPVTTAETLHPAVFLKRMYLSDSQVFTRYDGWVSHSYPNPGFMGNPNDIGRMSIKNYEWELSLVDDYNYDVNKPIFITETGWQTIQGKNRVGVSQTTASNYMRQAYTQKWTDSRIVAITPFILRYNQPPFEQFAWLNPLDDQPTPVYQAVQSLPKSSGKPVQESSGEVAHQYFPKELIKDRKYLIAVKYKNTGQSIWDSDETKLVLNHDLGEGAVFIEEVPRTEPGEISKVWVHIQTPDITSEKTFVFTLEDRDSPIIETSYQVNITPDTYLKRVRQWIDEFIHKDFNAAQ